MDVTYAIVQVYVTESNDVIKRHSIVITLWRTPPIELTALSKHLRSEMKGVQEKESIVCDEYIEKSVPRDHSLASLGKPRDARQ